MILKDFEQYEVNTLGKKPQSCWANQMRVLFKNGKHASKLTTTQKQFISESIKCFKASAYSETEQRTLTKWFSRFDWIKKNLGERYLLLESPKKLIGSFKISVATTLLYLLDARKELLEREDERKSFEAYGIHTSSTERNYRCAALIENFVSLDENQCPADALSNIIWNDLVRHEHEDAIKKKIASEGLSSLGSIIKGRSRDFPFKAPNFLRGDLTIISFLEERLAYWLFASLAIQPSDIEKLKISDIAIEKNSKGRIIFCEITYYKTRADRKYKPPLLKGNDIVARAILAYVAMRNNDSMDLFPREVPQQVIFSNPFSNLRKKRTSGPLAFLNLLWRSRHMQSVLDEAYSGTGFDSLFVDAIQAFLDPDATEHLPWSRSTEGPNSYEDYFKAVTLPLPISYFGAQQIKNSAVHARSDRYRDSDLVNDNSHTSLTEKLSYLTDSNQEWVNQVGRVTRMVFDDLINNVYSNLTAIDMYTTEKMTTTKFLYDQPTDNYLISKTGQVEYTDQICIDDDIILVVESETTAIMMFHYIDQADKFKGTLLEKNPIFFSQTVLPNVEWMHFCLMKFNLKIMKQAALKYKKIKAHLPDAFEYKNQGDF